jgi:hypothetical protein
VAEQLHEDNDVSAFTSVDVETVARAIDSAAEAEDQAHFHLPSEAMAQLDDGVVPATLRKLVSNTFFRYLRLEIIDPTRVSVVPNGDFAPEISNDEVAVWRALVAILEHPMPKRLVHDLLFLQRDGNVGQHAREAIGLYQATAATLTVSRHVRVHSALRALALIKLTNSADELPRALQLIQSMVDEDLADATQQPGLTLPMVAALVEAGNLNQGNEENISRLLEAVLDRYGIADHIDYIAELFRISNSVKASRKESVRTSRVTTRLNKARNNVTADAKMFYLEDAAKEARKLGFSDLYDEAVADLQQIDSTAMNWIKVSSEVEYPADFIASYLGSFTHHRDWKRGLRQWLATEPPSGCFADNEALARKTLEDSVIQHLFTRVRIGSHGMPERRGAVDDSLDSAIRDTEFRRAMLQGLPLFHALKAVGQLAEGVSEDELTAIILERYRCPGVNARILAKGLRLFWQSEYHVCAYFVTPFIEAGARTLLLTLNEPIYRVEAGKTKGQFAQLGVLLPRLEEEGFDHDWIRYLQTLTSADGQNYRNDIAHGFLRQIDPVVSTLLLRASALFLIMPLERSTAEEVRQLARRPVPQGPRRRFRRKLKDACSAAWRTLRQRRLIGRELERPLGLNARSE